MKYRILLLCVCLAGALAAPAAAVTLATGQPDNAAPIAEDLSLTTYKNVAVEGQCAAVDPEGDLITFRLADKPARGEVELSEDGSFRYTPFENKKGKDSFSYVAVDANGNESQPATVKILIEKQSTKVTYSDMAESPAHYAALRLAERGVYVGSSIGGTWCFSPDETVSRGEFLAMAMTCAGVDALEGVTATGFYDDDGIPAWTRGYVSAALMGGTVQGYQNGAGQVVFDAARPVTAAEAAVMVDRLLRTGDVAMGEAADSELVPTWASQAVANMTAVGVAPAGVPLSEPLTRGEAAEMLSAMLDVLDSREDSGWLFFN